MHEITIDGYKYFILDFKQNNKQGFARTFCREFNVDNAELLKISDDEEARDYIFNRYLLH